MSSDLAVALMGAIIGGGLAGSIATLRKLRPEIGELHVRASSVTITAALELVEQQRVTIDELERRIVDLRARVAELERALAGLHT